MGATTKQNRLQRSLARLTRRLRRGAKDESGAAAVFFAVALVLLAPLTLGMFDVYLASSQRTQLQDALDAASLFAARSTATTTAQIDSIGDKALAANLVLANGTTLVASNFALNGNTVTGYAEVTPSAIAPGLWPHSNISASSTVQRSVDRIEISLVLDNTGSMAGTKITTLKSAASSLIDKLVAAAARSTDPNPLKVALVPFAMTVRVQGSTATNNYNNTTHSGTGFPTWLDPQDAASATLGSAYDIFSSKTDRFTKLKAMNNTAWAGCVQSRRAPYDVQETAPTSATPATMFVPYFWPDEPDSSFSNSNSYVSDAAQNGWTWLQKIQNPAKYTGTPSSGTINGAGYAKGPNAGCTMQPLIRLTTDTASVKTAINNMVAVGDTNIPMGLVWGWHTLSPNAPFADGSAYGTDHLRKVVILMTDGTNTMTDSGNSNGSFYSGAGYIWQAIVSGLSSTNASTSARQQAMDARLSLLCSNMKAQNIYIYTVRVEVTSGTSTVLQNCATSPDMFYDVQDVSQLGAAFDAIAGSIDNLRISH